MIKFEEKIGIDYWNLIWVPYIGERSIFGLCKVSDAHSIIAGMHSIFSVRRLKKTPDFI